MFDHTMLDPKALNSIRARAWDDSRIECCGVIVELSDGTFGVTNARNLSVTPETHFILDPVDYAEAVKLGRIVAIYHSHSAAESARPSEADVAACNRLRVPYVLYYCLTDTFETIQPAVEPTPLIGRKFIWHVHDCYTLIQDYYDQTLGIRLPDFAYEPFFWRKGQNPYMEGFARAGFSREFGPPREHDVLLMQIHSPVPNHGAILAKDGKILHHLIGRLSCRDIYGGYWRRMTVHVVRHRVLA